MSALSFTPARLAATALGIVASARMPELDDDVHPVARFGSTMTSVERVLYRDTRGAGVGYAVAGVGLGLLAGRGATSTVGSAGGTVAATAVCVAGAQLRAVAQGIGDQLAAGDLDGARAALPALVGRDPSGLDASGIAAAVIESVAENMVDAVFAPAWWAAVGGAPGVAAYRAVNTMDAMVGRRNARYERFGWAAARTDDVANIVPARVFALAIAAVRPDRARAILATIRADAGRHPSPNAGVAEAAMAGALGCSLGGPLRYGDVDEDRPVLGSGPRPGPGQLAEALTIASRTEQLLIAALISGAVIGLVRTAPVSLPVPGPHGGDVDHVARLLGRPVDEILDLSASLNPLAPDCRPTLTAALDELDRYPDDTAATRALAEVMGVDADRLVLTNGGAEAIALVAQRHPRGWADECDFGLYRRHLTELDPSGPRWHSDPHNPTGRLAPAGERAAVRDEAFYLLATGRWTRGDEGTTVLGSLTKAWAIPGLRIGYVLSADADEADAIRALRPRWSVNGLVCAALPALLQLAEPERWRDGIADLRRQLVDVLAAHDLIADPSDANYVWVPRAPGLRSRLLPHGVVVRDGTSFGHPGSVRIAVPGPDGLDRLARALSDALDH